MAAPSTSISCVLRHHMQITIFGEYLSLFLGLFVIGPGEDGIFFEHRQSEWGDHANRTELMQAVERMAAKKDN